MPRDTCLYCEQDGVTTPLVQTVRGGLCPIHSAELLEAMQHNARITLGIPLPSLLGRGVPSRTPS